ncbi:MAG: dihydropteroate synthase [Actinomycetota bacterium]|nr:dihydropteroate synthase [Actinomycetota bacterium]
MAIINRTKDSFFDGGKTFGFSRALSAALTALDDGAHWVDIGGVPFSPISQHVTEAEELARVVPLVAEIRSRSKAIISVDTFRAKVATEALAAGADAINDTSGLRDPGIAVSAALAGASLVITHSKAKPREVLQRPVYVDVVCEVQQFLAAKVELAEKLGMPPKKIIIDPGHDLNKNTYHSLELTRRLSELTKLEYPLLVSVSNKDFVGEALDLPRNQLLAGTTATLVMCMMQGARIVRVHDVKAAVSAVRMFESVFGSRLPLKVRHNL